MLPSRNLDVLLPKMLVHGIKDDGQSSGNMCVVLITEQIVEVIEHPHQHHRAPHVGDRCRQNLVLIGISRNLVGGISDL